MSLALALGASRSHTAIARAMQRLVHMRTTSGDEGGDEFDLLFRAAAAAEQAVAASRLRHRSTVRVPGQWETDFFAQLRGEDELRLVERAADRAAEEFAEFLQVRVSLGPCAVFWLVGVRLPSRRFSIVGLKGIDLGCVTCH